MRRYTLTSMVALLLLVVLGGIVLHAPFIVYIQSHAPAWGLVAKAWKEIIMIIAGPLLAIVLTRHQMWRVILSDRLVQLGIGYIALHLLVVVVLAGDAVQIIAGLMIDLRFVAYAMLVYGLLKCAPHHRQRFISVAVAGAALVVGFACMQTVLPRDFLTLIGYGPDTIVPYMTVDRNDDYIRFASTLRGPNPLGAYAASVLVITAAYVMRKKQLVRRHRGALALLGLAAFVALWVSYARSAYLVLAVGSISAAAVVYGWRMRRSVWLGLTALVIIVGGLTMAFGRSNVVVSNVIFHENPGEGGMVDSNGQHLQSLEQGLGYVLIHPLGAGVGTTGSASLQGARPLIIENHYLFIAHEVGLLGLAVFVWLFGLVLVRLWHRRTDWLALGLFASGIGLGLAALILPVWADDTVAIVWWGLAAVAISQKEGQNGRATKQKTA